MPRKELQRSPLASLITMRRGDEAEVILQGIAGVFWEVLASFPIAFEKMLSVTRITTVNEALRNGNWETNCGGKERAGRSFFKEESKKIKSHQSWGIVWVAEEHHHPLPRNKFLETPPMHPLGQGSVNYYPWVKYSPLPVPVNKVLVEHSHVHLCTTYGCFYTEHPWQRQKSPQSQKGLLFKVNVKVHWSPL